jgi:RNA polymerase sigma-70 factor (ECF subfamily)
VLVDVQGLDYQSAADVLRIPPGTVKSRLSRARAAMRDRLAPHTELFPTHLRLNQ